MKAMNNRWVHGLTLAGILALSGGCGSADEYYGVNQNNYRDHRVSPEALSVPGDRPPLSYEPNVDGGPEGQLHNLSESRINDEQLATIAEGVPGVSHAKVLKNENEADVIVGIQVDDTGKRRIIEKQVYSALRWQYPEFNYHVTADETLFEQIKAADAGAGRSDNHARMQALNDQIHALVRAIARTITRP